MHRSQNLIGNLGAYSFGHLKSAKSSENGRLQRENFQLPKRMGILKTVDLADFAEKNAKRMGMEC